MPHGSSRPRIIIVIDDDASVRRALRRVLGSADLPCESFESAEAFLAADRESLGEIACIVADMTLPGMSGLDLRHRLNDGHADLPVIFLTAHDTDAMRDAAREAGAVSFFRKPVDTQALLDAIHWAIAKPKAAPAA